MNRNKKETTKNTYWMSVTRPASGSSLALFFDTSCAVAFCLAVSHTKQVWYSEHGR